jgi:hypothetical protein
MFKEIERMVEEKTAFLVKQDTSYCRALTV